MIQSSILFQTGIESHDFEPTIIEIQTVVSANVLVYNSLGIENWITKINNAHKIGASKGLNASNTDRRNMILDPPVWLDLVLAKKEVENITDGLMTIDPKVRTRSRIGYTDKMNENIKNLAVGLECNQ